MAGLVGGVVGIPGKMGTQMNCLHPRWMIPCGKKPYSWLVVGKSSKLEESTQKGSNARNYCQSISTLAIDLMWFLII